MIPTSAITQVKTLADLPALLRSQGVALQPMGKDLVCRCPYHDDTTPSLHLSQKENGWLWHCFGCGKGGDIFTWLMEQGNISFHEAYHKAEKLCGIESTASQSQQISASQAHIKISEKDDPQALLNKSTAYYHQALLSESAPQAYLKSRGIYNEEAVLRFQLGFCNHTLSKILPYRKSQIGKAVRGNLEKIGILRKDKQGNYREHFIGCLIIPILDRFGNVKGMYGRRTALEIKKGSPLHLYLSGKREGIFNPECLGNSEIILCESLIDALSFWCNGHKAVTSSYGINGFNGEHIESFQKYEIKRVYIAYDSDKPGEKASKEVSQKLMESGIEAYRIQFNDCKDANEFIQKYRPSSKALAELMENAKSMNGVQAAKIAASHEIEKALSEAEDHQEKINPTEFSSLAANAESSQTLINSEVESDMQMEEAAKKEKNISSETPTQAEKKQTSSSLSEAAQSSEPLQMRENRGFLEVESGERKYRIYGWEKNLSYGVMKAGVHIKHKEIFYTDQIDLFNARQRANLIEGAKKELGIEEAILKRDIGKIFGKLEEMQEREILRNGGNTQEKEAYQMSEKERGEAIAYLKAPGLLKRIARDIEICGLVGERISALVLYLCVVSRFLEDPLSAMIQALSAAGKSTLMKIILALCPQEHKETYSAITERALFYKGIVDLSHKVLAIAEEEGAEEAKYAIKTLQSEKVLSIATTGKNAKTEDIKAKDSKVLGPVCFIMTSTNAEIEEELENRFVLVNIEESRVQTQEIHKLQRIKRTLEGKMKEDEKEQIIKLHQNVQRVLRKIEVLNPYAPYLKYPDNAVRTHRDNDKYLTIIETIAFLHQYQRPHKKRMRGSQEVEYIEVELSDIEMANHLCNEVLGRSLRDLPIPTQRLLEKIYEMVKSRAKALGIELKEYLFTRREIREYTGLSHSQIKKYLPLLEEMEYLIVHSGGKEKERRRYELLYKGEGMEGNKFLLGLVSIEELKRMMEKSGNKHEPEV